MGDLCPSEWTRALGPIDNSLLMRDVIFTKHRYAMLMQSPRGGENNPRAIGSKSEEAGRDNESRRGTLFASTR